MIKSVVLCAALLAAAPLASAATPADDLSRCARIADVQVPYEVDVGESAIVFSDGHARISVTAEAIQSPEGEFHGAPVAAYYRDLRGFLDEAGSMAVVAKSFFKRGPFPQAATAMCGSILAVHASARAVEQQFPGFRSPVQVELD